MLVWFSLDYFADFIYVLDILIHFRTGYLEDGVLQTDTHKLRIHYMNSTTFYVDGLCLLPLDFLYLSLGFNSLFRFFRLVKLNTFLNLLDQTERHTNVPNFFRSIILMHYLLITFHWNACIYYIAAMYDSEGSMRSVIFDWAQNKTLDQSPVPGTTWPKYRHFQVGSEDPSSHLDSQQDVVFIYLKAFYWCTLALTTIGDLPRPITKSDYVFQIVQLTFGLLLFATVLGHVANIVTNVSAARKEFQGG